MATTTRVGDEKYLSCFWVIEAFDLDVALKLATEGSKACNRKVEVRCNSAKAAGRTYGRRRCPAMASTSRIVHSRRARKVLKDIREAVSGRGSGVRSRATVGRRSCPIADRLSGRPGAHDRDSYRQPAMAQP
jgi:hypothetical protein